MPQPPISLEKFLAVPLPAARENYAPGGGATGPRKEFAGNLEGVSVIPDWEGTVQSYIDTLPTHPLPSHPSHRFPNFLTAQPNLPIPIKNAQDLQQHLKQIPLASVAASLTALKAFENKDDLSQKGSKGLDAAGYESDGGEEVSSHGMSRPELHHTATNVGDGSTTYGWKFSKSPMGSGEFLLVNEGKEEDAPVLVVRTINSTAFGAADWNELVVDGPYHYNTKSKASWYWSRKFSACKRLGCRWFAFTDYQKWVFGCFSEDYKHANISPIMSYSAGAGGKGVSVLEALMYWSRSAFGEKDAYKVAIKDVSSLPKPFTDNPPRRTSVSGGKSGGRLGQVKAANESDIEESDVEAH